MNRPSNGEMGSWGPRRVECQIRFCRFCLSASSESACDACARALARLARRAMTHRDSFVALALWCQAVVSLWRLHSDSDSVETSCGSHEAKPSPTPRTRVGRRTARPRWVGGWQKKDWIGCCKQDPHSANNTTVLIFSRPSIKVKADVLPSFRSGCRRGHGHTSAGAAPSQTP